MSEKETTKGAKRNLMIIAAVSGSAVIITGLIIMNSLGSDKSQAIAASSEVPEIQAEAIPRDPNEKPINTEELSKLNKELDANKAQEVSKEGGTYVPDMIAGETQMINEETNKEKPNDSIPGSGVPQTAMENNSNMQLQQQQQQQQQQQFPAAALVGLEELIQSSKPMPSVSGSTLDVSKFNESNSSNNNKTVETNKTNDCPINRECNSSGDIIIIHAGNSIFAQLELSINTDEKSPVFAKIISSDPLLNGKKMIGEFYQNPNYTVGIKFNSISLDSGMISVDGIVVDSQTGRAALAGKVDHKYLERFGLPMIAAASGKYAELIGQQGTQMISTNGTIMTASNIPISQIRTAAIAEGVKSAGSTLNETAKSAKISTELPNNIGVQVKFLQDVIIKNERRQ